MENISITIFIVILICDVAYNVSYFICEYLQQFIIINNPIYILLIVIFSVNGFDYYYRLFQSCIFISITNVLKHD